MNQKIYLSSEFDVIACTRCGLVFAVVQEYLDKKREDHKNFYCPKGHSLHFPGMSKEEKLQMQLKHCQLDRDFWQDGHNIERDKRKAIKRSNSALKGAITKMKKRIRGNGLPK